MGQAVEKRELTPTSRVSENSLSEKSVDRTRAKGSFALKRVFSELGVVLLYFICWSAMFYPAVFTIHEGYFGGVRSDPAAYTWYSLHNIQRVLTWPSAGFDASYFYPFGKSLAYSDNFILPSLIAKPIYLLTGNHFTAYNLTMIIAAVLNGYLAFCLTCYLTRREVLSFLAGFTFMCLPFLYGHLGHPQLQFAFVLPAIALVTLIFVETRSPWAATAIGFCVFAQFFSTAYYSLIAYLLSGLILLAYGLMRFKTLRVRDFVVLLVVNIPWAIGLFFASGAYRAVRETFGAMHPALVRHYSASFSSYIAAPPRHLLWGKFAAPYARNGSFLSVGFTTLVLAAFGIGSLVFLYRLGRDRDPAFPRLKKVMSGAVVLSVAWLVISHLFAGDAIAKDDTLRAYVVSAGLWTLLVVSAGFLLLRGFTFAGSYRTLGTLDYAYLVLFLCVFFFFASFGIIGTHGSDTPNPGLYIWMYEYLPGFNSMRAIYRFGIVTGLMLAIMAAFGLSFIFSKKVFSQSGSRRWILFGVIAGLVVAELKTVPYAASKDRKRPSVYRALDAIPGDEAVISLPFMSVHRDGVMYPRFQTGYMKWSLPTGRPMMSGWSSKLPIYYQTAGFDLDTFPDQKAMNKLGQIVGLKYVVYYRPHVKRFRKKIFLSKLDSLGDQVETLHIDRRDNFLFRIHPVIDLLELEFPEYYLPPNAGREREFSFEIKLEGSELQPPLKIPVRTGYYFDGEEKRERFEDIQIERSNEWVPLSLDLPKSTHLVIPHKVRFMDLDKLPAERVMVRKVSARGLSD